MVIKLSLMLVKMIRLLTFPLYNQTVHLNIKRIKSLNQDSTRKQTLLI